MKLYKSSAGPQLMTDHYTEIVPYYDSIVRLLPSFDYEKDSKTIEEMIKSKTNGIKVLEIGSGTSNMTLTLHDLDFDVTGIESSFGMFKEAYRKFLFLDVLQRDILELDLEERFDAAVMYQSVFAVVRNETDYYVESYLRNRDEAGEALTRISSHLNPQGLLVMSAREKRLSRPLLIGNGLLYETETEQIEDEEVKITHRVIRKDEIVAESVVRKHVLPLFDFNMIAAETGFGGFQFLDNFYSMQKQ